MKLHLRLTFDRLRPAAARIFPRADRTDRDGLTFAFIGVIIGLSQRGMSSSCFALSSFASLATP